MVAQLGAGYPSVDAVTVEATVRTAYDSFHEARVRNCIPILVERRSQRVQVPPATALPVRPSTAG
ncbi:three-helix bundle dimerization domain-containing protein [Streptomyces sp. NPDC055134]